MHSQSVQDMVKRAFRSLDTVRQRYFPGICVAVTIGVAASFLSQQYGAPAMLMALLLGLSFNFLRNDAVCLPGIEFSARTLLRIGVALLGLRITCGDVMTLGWSALFLVCCAVILTIAFGVLVAKRFEISKRFGLLTGGAVAICGASAAMAISAVLPDNEQTKRDTLFAVIAVTTLSTVAMVVYPLISHGLQLTNAQTGIFLGGTIHDVAQVVGAGYSISAETGDLSTFVKLIRVAMLVPIVLGVSFWIQKNVTEGVLREKKVAFPFFLLGFFLIFIINSLQIVPVAMKEFFSASTSWLLLTAVAALGVRTSLEEILTVGWRPVLLVVMETVFLAFVVLLGILCL